MIATDRPRFNLCSACVLARGFERGEDIVRVLVDVAISGVCDDCGASADLEAWRRLDVPPPASTIPVLPLDSDDCEDNP